MKLIVYLGKTYIETKYCLPEIVLSPIVKTLKLLEENMSIFLQHEGRERFLKIWKTIK